MIHVQRRVANVPSVCDGVLQVTVTDGLHITSEEWNLSKSIKLKSQGSIFLFVSLSFFASRSIQIICDTF
jgi:hypothetical protein